MTPASSDRGAQPTRGTTTDTVLLGGRYDLGELIGRGGMADVRIGVDRRLGRRVAVKQLRSDLSRDPTSQVRFRREAQSAASLNHPSIVAVYDTGEHADESGAVVPYIVMEHVEGESLREILSSGRKVMPHRALEITAEVLSALTYSHHAGIVHRDIKPANVMLAPSGRTKVMDFGIARSVSDSSVTMTQASSVVGTAQYLSPEQARGEAVDARSDVYSTGCLLFELLTGRPPFEGDSPVAVAYQHVREQPPAPSTLAAEITPTMDAIVARSLAKKPTDRYQSAAAMRADIERALGGQHVSAPAGATASPVASTATWAAPARSGAPAGATVSQPLPSPAGRGRKRGLWWVLALLVAAGAVATVLLVPWLLDDTLAADTEVPDVVGMSLTDANLELTRGGLDVRNVDREPDGAPVGEVLKQEPTPYALVAADAKVDLVVSSGPADVQVPYLLGEKRRVAVQALEDAGLGSRVRFEDSDARKGTVLDTDPDATSMVEPGETVLLVVSAGPTRVPEVLGLPQASAQAALTKADLLYSVVEDPGSEQPAGLVIGQTPSPGAEVSAGQTVIITVSARPAPTTPPLTTPPETATPETTPPETTPPETTPPETTSPTDQNPGNGNDEPGQEPSQDPSPTTEPGDADGGNGNEGGGDEGNGDKGGGDEGGGAGAGAGNGSTGQG